MNRNVQIGSLLLSAYFIVLPILFGCHSSLHKSHQDNCGNHDMITTTIGEDCSLCDLYNSQIGTESILPSFKNRTVKAASIHVEADELVKTYSERSSLRGPPVV